MINASKFYITNNFTQTIWSQNSTHLLAKIRDCIQLNEEYQRCFHVIKEKLASTPNERPFDFSEMYIFGKFDAFVRRCERIIEMFDTINVFFVVERIENRRFNTICIEIQYDFIVDEEKRFGFSRSTKTRR